jgi:hypothetical protein
MQAWSTAADSVLQVMAVAQAACLGRGFHLGPAKAKAVCQAQPKGRVEARIPGRIMRLNSVPASVV